MGKNLFFDETKNYEDQIAIWNEPEILCVKVTGQFFTLKYRLEHELQNKKVFLYFNRQFCWCKTHGR